jgi:hypothetical protein
MFFVCFNLVSGAILTSLIMNDRPTQIVQFVGGSASYSVGKYQFERTIYTITSIASFGSLWITTALLLNYYKEGTIKAIKYWIVLFIPLIYFVLNLLSKPIVINLLGSYLTEDPVTFTIILTGILSLSKPIGGFTFALAFLTISKVVSYEKNIKSYMAISGWAIFLLFTADQAVVQTQL